MCRPVTTWLNTWFRATGSLQFNACAYDIDLLQVCCDGFHCTLGANNARPVIVSCLKVMAKLQEVERWRSNHAVTRWLRQLAREISSTSKPIFTFLIYAGVFSAPSKRRGNSHTVTRNITLSCPRREGFSAKLDRSISFHSRRTQNLQPQSREFARGLDVYMTCTLHLYVQCRSPQCAMAHISVREEMRVSIKTQQVYRRLFLLQEVLL